MTKYLAIGIWFDRSSGQDFSLSREVESDDLNADEDEIVAMLIKEGKSAESLVQVIVVGNKDGVSEVVEMWREFDFEDEDEENGGDE